MLGYLLPILGMIGGLLIIDQRENIGDMFGETKWIHEHGGIYTWMIILGLFIFFWSLGELTGTTDFLFSPIRAVLPGEGQEIDPLLLP